MTRKYAFLDRDGTLIFEPQNNYQIDSLKKLKILEGVIEALQKLIQNNYKLMMISNQDGLGTKSFPTKNFKIPQIKMLNIFKENNIKFEKIFICPHLPKDNCECRKPKIELLNEFLNEANIDFKNSFICGDRNSDIEFAKNLNLKAYKIKTNSNQLLKIVNNLIP